MYAYCGYISHMTVLETKSERIAVRVTPKQKALLAQAAALRGRSLTDFVVDIAQKEAERDLERMRIIRLSAQNQQQLAELIVNPPEPNKHLIDAANAYDRADIISR